MESIIKGTNLNHVTRNINDQTGYPGTQVSWLSQKSNYRYLFAGDFNTPKNDIMQYVNNNNLQIRLQSSHPFSIGNHISHFDNTPVSETCCSNIRFPYLNQTSVINNSNMLYDNILSSILQPSQQPLNNIYVMKYPDGLRPITSDHYAIYTHLRSLTNITGAKDLNKKYKFKKSKSKKSKSKRSKKSKSKRSKKSKSKKLN